VAKVVLRWPLLLDPAGRLLTDDTHRTGLRFITTTQKRSILGDPKRGLSLPFLEQATNSVDAERLVLLASLFMEIGRSVSLITIHGVSAVRLPADPRGLYIDVLYTAEQLPSAQPTIFRFALPQT
jgi:hypothetical protein